VPFARAKEKEKEKRDPDETARLLQVFLLGAIEGGGGGYLIWALCHGVVREL
jgi:hypothetical protein